MKIGTREVGPGHPTFIIAEIGSNHGGSLDRALALIDAAADAGADAAKFQYFRVDRFIVPRENPEALRRYELPDGWLVTLKTRCAARGIEFLCTAFDLASLDAIDPFVNAHKVGSYEAPDTNYWLAVESKGKPIIASTGRIQHPAVPSDDLVLLRCVSKYPAPIGGYLSWTPAGKWGVSDHTLHPTIVPAAAVALGACVVEKHMRPFNRAEYEEDMGYVIRGDDPPDWPVSINPDTFSAMVEAIRLTESAVRG